MTHETTFAARRPWLLGAAIFALVIAAYVPVWHAGFIWDDDVFLVENPLLKSAHGLYQLWFTSAAPDYFPMSSTSLWLEWRFWGNHALGYHVTNVLLHAASAVVLWRVLVGLRIPGAWFAAALFAVHPVNVESVAWITERKNTLAMLFYALSVWAWVRCITGREHCRAGPPDAAVRPPISKAGISPSAPIGFATEDAEDRISPLRSAVPPAAYFCSLGFFVLALLSKTAVAPLPFVLVGIVWWVRGRIGRRDLVAVTPFFMAAATLGLVTVAMQYGHAIGDTVVRTDGFGSRLAIAGCAIWFYLSKVLLPLNLSFVYPRWQIDPANVLAYVPAALVAIALAIAWHWRTRWGRSVVVAFGYFVLLLLPILGFLNIYFMRYSLVADHWQYFAAVGPIAFIVAVVTAWASRAPMRRGVLVRGCGVVAVLALAGLTRRQAGNYANAETLWRATVATHPDAFLAQNNLGIILLANGNTDEAIPHLQQALAANPSYAEARANLATALLAKGQVDAALEQFNRALELQPRSADIENNLGNVWLRKGRPDEALQHYRKALELRPMFAVAHCNVGAILLDRGALYDALAHYQKALMADPASSLARYNIGYILLQRRRVDESIACFEQAVASEPNLAPAHYQLGNAYILKGRTAEAIEQLERTLTLEPSCTDAHVTLAALFQAQHRTADAVRHSRAALRLEPDNVKVSIDLAWLLATCSDGAVRNGAEAVRLAEDANRRTRGREPAALRVLAAAYAEVGRYDDAAALVRQALGMAPESRLDAASTAALHAQLVAYQAHRPFRPDGDAL